jgi:hypothetical protein
MKYQIIEFRNEKYGIRRRNIIQQIFNYGGDYYDFKGSFYYPFKKPTDYYFKHCFTNDIKQLFEMHSLLTDNFIEKIIK